LQNRVLHYILGVLFVMRDVLRYAEDITVIPVHQLAESFQVAFFGGLNQRQLVADIFPSSFLDGFHAAPTQNNLLCFALLWGAKESRKAKEFRTPYHNRRRTSDFVTGP